MKLPLTLLVLGALLTSGCAMEPVKPWQRGNLALPEMAWDPGRVEESAMRAHTYFSKEAASGGASLGGGGCGCN